MWLLLSTKQKGKIVQVLHYNHTVLNAVMAWILGVSDANRRKIAQHLYLASEITVRIAKLSSTIQ